MRRKTCGTSFELHRTQCQVPSLFANHSLFRVHLPKVFHRWRPCDSYDPNIYASRGGFSCRGVEHSAGSGTVFITRQHGSTDSRRFFRQAGGCNFNLPHFWISYVCDFLGSSASVFTRASICQGNELGIESKGTAFESGGDFESGRGRWLWVFGAASPE